jgi:vacuole morphology and inheritance protein 14
MTREEIKWQELFNHFRAVQSKHEKSRRMGNGSAGPLLDGYQEKRPTSRRRTTNDGTGVGAGAGVGMGAGSPTSPSSATAMNVGSVPPRALSPLNPRSSAQRQQASLGIGGGMAGMSGMSGMSGQANGLFMNALGGASAGAVGQPRAMSPTLMAAQKGRPIPRGLNLGRK